MKAYTDNTVLGVTGKLDLGFWGPYENTLMFVIEDSNTVVGRFGLTKKGEVIYIESPMEKPPHPTGWYNVLRGCLGTVPDVIGPREVIQGVTTEELPKWTGKRTKTTVFTLGKPKGH